MLSVDGASGKWVVWEATGMPDSAKNGRLYVLMVKKRTVQ